MNNEKQAVKEALKEYYVGSSLSDEQLKSLQVMQNIPPQYSVQNNKNHYHVFKWMGSIAASIMLFVVLIGYLKTPEVISAAYVDAAKDARIHNGMQTSIAQWLSEINITSVPDKYPVEMSKFCKLNNYLTTHFRIAGVEQGELHLFFHHGSRPIYWFNSSGDIDDMKWKLVKVRDDLTLIVMYTSEMREKSVQFILDKMLPELLA